MLYLYRLMYAVAIAENVNFKLIGVAYSAFNERHFCEIN
jgi:hypothetical protein